MTGKETTEEPLDHQQLFSFMRSLRGGGTLYSGKSSETFYFINYNSFKKLERMDSAVPQQSTGVC